jgi:hypothetical protein
MPNPLEAVTLRHHDDTAYFKRVTPSPILALFLFARVGPRLGSRRAHFSRRVDLRRPKEGRASPRASLTALQLGGGLRDP